MKELNITVMAPGLGTKSYLFSGGPLLIGRSEHCDLAVCHEAVPRELCRVWLQGDGATVRLEERPGSTNPLTSCGRPVRGGITGERIGVEIGPVRLAVSAAAKKRRGGAAGGAKRVRTVFLVTILALGAIASVAMGMGRSEESPREFGVDDLPSSHGLARSRAELPNQGEGLGGAGVLVDRADEILGRGKVPAAKRLEAADMLEAAGRLLSAAGMVREGAGHLSRARLIAREIDLEYRAERLNLKRSLEAGDAASAARSAKAVLSLLPGADRRTEDWLRALVAAEKEEGRR